MSITSPFGHMHIPDNVSVSEYVLNHMEGWGDNPAFIDAATGSTVTFREVGQNIRRFASVLAKWHLEKGERVLIFSPNHIQYCAAIYGAAYAGAIVATINNNYTAAELNYMIEDSEPVYIISTEKLASTVIEAASQYSKLKGIILLSGQHEGCQTFQKVLAEGDPLYVSHIEVNPKEDVLFLPYSSGTTGRSKGVMVTHYNILAMVALIGHPAYKSDKYGQQVYMMFLPFYHIYALGVIMAGALCNGFTQVMMDTFDFELFLKSIVKYKVTMVPLVPPVALLLAKDPRARQYDLSCVDTIMSGAAPLDANIEEEVIKITGARFRQGWGMTETPAAIVNPSNSIKHGTCGLPLPNTEAMVVDIVTRKPLGPNQDGELVIKGPQVMKGYWRRSEATAETFTKDGWLLTGDIARYDDQGYLSVVDRLKELIKWKGLQVPPADLEFLILKHPDVADVAVIGVPDVEAGELPRAYVVRKPNVKVTEKDIVEFVSKRVSPHKRLRGGVEFISEIPKSASGKILRRTLKDQLRPQLKAKY